ncbi:MAG: hypothetical protein KDC38_03965 [Planctomycetes bacterium]|nr:hypothetical protein [Planctomycetota bacterium]
MAILGFTGKLSVAVGITWKGDLVANAMTTKLQSASYVLANEAVTELTIGGLFGARFASLERKATPRKPKFDKTLQLYTMDPASSNDVERFLGVAKGTKFFAAMTLQYEHFYETLVREMTRTDADLHNFAHPNDSKPILATFKHRLQGNQVSIRYESVAHRVRGLEIHLVDTEVKPPPKGSKVPSVKLQFEIDFGSSPTAEQQDLMRKFIAMDWSRLARFGKPDTKRKDVDLWIENVITYLVNHTDMARAERFRKQIVDRHKTKAPDVLARELRDDLDLHLITANHWGQLREDLKTEHHQRLCSDLFGTLHQMTWLSSPVFMQRTISDRHLKSLDQTAALILQYGTGHCGEHATCSFSVLRSIMGEPSNQVTSVIFSGNANVDHAFVVYNLKLDITIRTRIASPTNTRVPKKHAPADEVYEVFNLRDALAAQPLKPAFVMDPYLDKTVMKPRADDLLVALNSPKRKNARQDTDFLAYGGYHPPPEPTMEDITSLPAADRRKRVKNV